MILLLGIEELAADPIDHRLRKIDLSPRYEEQFFDDMSDTFYLVKHKKSLIQRVKDVLQEVFNTPHDFYNLQVDNIIDDGITRHVGYKVEVNGYAIENLYLSVHLVDNEIIHMNGTGFVDLSDIYYPPDPLLTTADVKDIIVNLFETSQFSYFEVEDIYYYHQGEMYIAKKVEFSSPLLNISAWRVIIDAETGDLLSKSSLLFDLTGKGRVYPQNKVKTPNAKIVDLVDLNENTDKLQGKFARVFNSAPNVQNAVSPTLEFIYSDDDSHFGEVSTYYYATQILKWFDSYDIPLGSVITYYVHVPDPNNPSGPGWNNANYDPFDKSVHIGDGDGKFLQNLSIDSDVVMHETVHHILYFYAGIKSLDGESGGIHEGTADFFTYHLAGDACLGESAIADGNKCIRTGINELVYPEDINKDIHVSGDIWVATLWQVRSSLVNSLREEFALLVLKSLPFIQNPRGEFVDFSNALLLADKQYYNGKYKCEIATNFIIRGFYFTTKEVSLDSCDIDPSLNAANIEKRKELIKKKTAASIPKEKVDDESNGDDDKVLGLFYCAIHHDMSSSKNYAGKMAITLLFIFSILSWAVIKFMNLQKSI